MKNLKKILMLVLAAAMLLSLAACGEKPADKPENTPTPDYVYASEFTTLPNTYEGQEAYFDIRIIDENGFLGVVSEKVGERELEEGEIVTYEGQLDVYEQRLYRMDFSGKMTKLAYEPMKVTTEHGGEQTSWINGLIGTDDGFVSIEEVYTSWNNAPASVSPESDEYYMYYQSEDHYYVRTLDAEGRELKMAEMDVSSLLNNGEYVNAYRAAVLEDGSVLLTGENALYVFDSGDGRLLYRVETDMAWIMNVFSTSEGEVFVMGYVEEPNGWFPVLRPFDAKSRRLGASMSIDGDLYDVIPGSGNYLLYYTNGDTLYGYDREKKEGVKLFNWIAVDVLKDDLTGYTVLEDGSVLGLMTEWDKNYEKATRTLVSIREVPSTTLPEKTVLTLAVDYLDWDLRRELVHFNRTNGTTRIEVLDYSEYNDYEKDYGENGSGEDSGLTKLRTEILAGNLPDIIALTGMPTRQLAAKGLLMDLYPLLDADPELSREDIFPNVLKAMETDGKLSFVTSSFYIYTCVGARAVVGDTPGWTYAQLNEAMATMPEGCSVFGVGTTRDSVLETWAHAEGSSLQLELLRGAAYRI